MWSAPPRSLGWQKRCSEVLHSLLELLAGRRRLPVAVAAGAGPGALVQPGAAAAAAHAAMPPPLQRGSASAAAAAAAAHAARGVRMAASSRLAAIYPVPGAPGPSRARAPWRGVVWTALQLPAACVPARGNSERSRWSLWRAGEHVAGVQSGWFGQLASRAPADPSQPCRAPSIVYTRAPCAARAPVYPPCQNKTRDRPGG